MFSKFLAASYREDYLHYSRVGAIMIKREGVPPLLIDVIKYVLETKTVRITHFDNINPYNLSKEDILVMIQAAVTLVRDVQKATHSHENIFYRHGNALLDELCIRFWEQGEELFWRSRCFLKISSAKCNLSLIPVGFISSVHPFH